MSFPQTGVIHRDYAWIVVGEPKKHGQGRDVGRIPCLLQGMSLYLAWLTEEEIRGGWRPLRLLADKGYIPSWITHGKGDELFYTPPDMPPIHRANPFRVTLERVRSGWLCLTGTQRKESGEHTVIARNVLKEGARVLEASRSFDWGTQMWNTFFVPASEAVRCLCPDSGKIPKTIHDHISEGGAIGAEDLHEE